MVDHQPSFTTDMNSPKVNEVRWQNERLATKAKVQVSTSRMFTNCTCTQHAQHAQSAKLDPL